jgi:outer membrane protein assembly factor BamD
LAVLLAACAGTKDNIDITKPVTGEAATNAQRAYQKGLEERKSQNFLEATRYFEWVRNNFPYSQYAALSELALADMSYERDDWASAAAAYQDFVKSHPSHPKADYASYRVGLAYYQDKPSDWFLLPPSFEKDQAPIHSALDALQRFTLAYPKSEFVTRAKDLIAECRERLAAHERYVAEFYWKRGGWRGAAGRWMVLADAYGDLDGGNTRSDSLWRAALAWRNAMDPAKEKAALTRLIEEAPNSPHRRDADQMLKELPTAPPPAPTPPAQPPPADQPPQPTPPAQPNR